MKKHHSDRRAGHPATGANCGPAERSSGTLTVNCDGRLRATRFGRQFCPPGTPSTTATASEFTGAAGIPGLGRATVTYVKSFDDTICPDQVTQQKTTLIDVAGKGQLKIAMDYPLCVDYAPASSVQQRDGRPRARESSRGRREASSSRPRSAAPRAAPAGAGDRRTTRGRATCRSPASSST